MLSLDCHDELSAKLFYQLTYSIAEIIQGDIG